ncbi:MAG: hypothetical protein AAGD35_02125 [Actinomycetota bacterium]
MTDRVSRPPTETEELLRATLARVGEQIEVDAPPSAADVSTGVDADPIGRPRRYGFLAVAAGVVVMAAASIAVLRPSTFRFEDVAGRSDITTDDGAPASSPPASSDPAQTDVDVLPVPDDGVPDGCRRWLRGAFVFGRTPADAGPQCVRVPASQPHRFENPLDEWVEIEVPELGTLDVWRISAGSGVIDFEGMTVGETLGLGVRRATSASGQVWEFHVVPAAVDPFVEHRLSAEGLGPVRIGMTVAEASDVLGGLVFDVDERGAPTSTSFTCGYMGVPDLSDGPLFMLDYGAADAEPDDAVIIRIDAGATTRTTSGLGVGSTESGVRAAFGDALTEELSKYGDLVDDYRLVHSPDGTEGDARALGFWTDDGEVIAVSAGFAGEIDSAGGCS